MPVEYRGPRPLHIATVCGVGQGTSLLMKMYMEDVVKELGIPAKVESMELVSARASGAHVIVASVLHVDELRGAADIVIGLRNLIDKNEMKEKLLEALRSRGMVSGP